MTYGRSTGIIYYCSGGYLFQTMVSASQAALNSPPSTAVTIVVHCEMSDEPDEYRTFEKIGNVLGVQLVNSLPTTLRGASPRLGRFFLDLAVDSSVDDILYLDGDTQIVGDLSPLLSLPVSPGRVWGVRDPMVSLSRVSGRFARMHSRWWDSVSYPLEARMNYINSGMFKVRRETLVLLREGVLQRSASSDLNSRFHDQDFFNLSAISSVDLLTPKWNFPGFWLGSRVQELCDPRVVHFMSNPRPWNAPVAPFGDEWFDVYDRFAMRFPASRRYWQRFSWQARLRYRLQQRWKQARERGLWDTPRFAEVLRELSADELDPSLASKM